MVAISNVGSQHSLRKINRVETEISVPISDGSCGNDFEQSWSLIRQPVYESRSCLEI